MSWRIARCKKSGRCPEWSSYATAPRKVVRIWGMLANGKLYVTVVPAKGVMPIKKCAPTIQKECPKWIKDAFWKGCSAGYPLDSKARPVVGAAAILRIYKQGRLLV